MTFACVWALLLWAVIAGAAPWCPPPALLSGLSIPLLGYHLPALLSGLSIPLLGVVVVIMGMTCRVYKSGPNRGDKLVRVWALLRKRDFSVWAPLLCWAVIITGAALWCPRQVPLFILLLSGVVVIIWKTRCVYKSGPNRGGKPDFIRMRCRRPPPAPTDNAGKSRQPPKMFAMLAACAALSTVAMTLIVPLIRMRCRRPPPASTDNAGKSRQ